MTPARAGERLTGALIVETRTGRGAFDSRGSLKLFDDRDEGWPEPAGCYEFAVDARRHALGVEIEEDHRRRTLWIDEMFLRPRDDSGMAGAVELALGDDLDLGREVRSQAAEGQRLVGSQPIDLFG